MILDQDSDKAAVSAKDGKDAKDRRRHPRYRLSNPITVRTANGSSVSGMTLEISEGGMSMATAENLTVGETVEIELVGAGKASAVVRHNRGRFYGLEFVKLTDDQIARIRDTCSRLPVFHANSLNI